MSPAPDFHVRTKLNLFPATVIPFSFAENIIFSFIFLHPELDLLQHNRHSKIFSPPHLQAPCQVCGYVLPLSGQQS